MGSEIHGGHHRTCIAQIVKLCWLGCSGQL